MKAVTINPQEEVINQATDVVSKEVISEEMEEPVVTQVRKRGRPPKQPTTTVSTTGPPSRKGNVSLLREEQLLNTIQQMEEYIQKQKMKKMIKKTIQREHLKHMNRVMTPSPLRRYSSVAKVEEEGSSNEEQEQEEEDEVEEGEEQQSQLPLQQRRLQQQQQQQQIRNPLLKTNLIPDRRVTRSWVKRR